MLSWPNPHFSTASLAKEECGRSESMPSGLARVCSWQLRSGPRLLLHQLTCQSSLDRPVGIGVKYVRTTMYYVLRMHFAWFLPRLVSSEGHVSPIFIIIGPEVNDNRPRVWRNTARVKQALGFQSGALLAHLMADQIRSRPQPMILKIEDEFSGSESFRISQALYAPYRGRSSHRLRDGEPCTTPVSDTDQPSGPPCSHERR